MTPEARDMLVVDLDGTLLRSDMLAESFWSVLSHDWRSIFRSVGEIRKGRASLKRHLAIAARIDPATLPYDSEVVSYVKAWRDAGGRTALVTATDETIARAIANHLGIFDEVHGSDGTLNLKGERKGAFLENRFGARSFAYMGDASADLPVWRRAGKAITVNAPAGLRRDAERVSADVEHLSTRPTSFRSYVKALRPHQWLKNLLVFLPMLAAHSFGVPVVVCSILAFVSFSLIASSVYILNDLLDLSADRSHPTKKNRPFAAGKIPISHGTAMAAGLILAGSLVAMFLSIQFFRIVAGYFILTSAYSLYLKRRIVIDICVLAGLYTIRIVAGGIATGIPLSVWLLAFSIFFFLSLAAVKRQAELVDSAARGELTASGRGYHVDDLPIISMIAIAAGYVSVLVLALYVNSPTVLVLYSQPEALWGVCVILLYWITRTVMVAHRGHMHDDPVVYAARDPISQVCLVLVLVFLLGGMIS